MDAKQKGILIDHKIPSADTDQEYLEQYQGKIIDSQNRQLLPLKEDLADWINKSLGKWIVILECYLSIKHIINTSVPLDISNTYKLYA